MAFTRNSGRQLWRATPRDARHLVTLQSRATAAGADSDTAYPGLRARQHEPSAEDLLAADVALGSTAATWVLFSPLPVTPKVGDAVLDDSGVVWEVRAVRSSVLGSAYALTTVKDR